MVLQGATTAVQYKVSNKKRVSGLRLGFLIRYVSGRFLVCSLFFSRRNNRADRHFGIEMNGD